MLTKNNAKFVKSLQLKKYRQKESLFIVEGEKNTAELLHSTHKIKQLICSQEFLKKYEQDIQQKNAEIVIVDRKQIKNLGTYQTNEQAIAVVHEPAEKEMVKGGFQLILDDLRDPGNLGAIIRIADWYGISQIICSETTAEFFNPKTISASMGSIFRVKLYRRKLTEFLSSNELPTFGALMNGENVHHIKFPREGYLIIGNESNGIKKEILPYIKQAITIPRIGEAESLNAAMATAIICDNIFREV